jgi:hypothetical protein
MLDLHGIKLSLSDLSSLKHFYEKNGGYVKYKDVLHQITINKELSDPITGLWLFVKPQHGITKATPSQIGAGGVVGAVGGDDALSMMSRMSVASRVSMSPSIMTADLNRFKEQFMLSNKGTSNDQSSNMGEKRSK